MIEYWTDWKQVKGKWNWINFTLINIYFEYSAMFATFEVSLGLLGFNIRITFDLPETKESKAFIRKLKRREKEWEKLLK